MARTPDEIRASIEENRVELAASLNTLRHEVTELTDWRSQLRRNQQPLMAGAAGVGFVAGGGIGGLVGLVFGRKRRKQRRRATKAAKQAAGLTA
jgi:hypothetical protein